MKMRKQCKYLLSLGLTLSMVLSCAGGVQAARKPKLSTGKVTVKVGKTKTVKVKNTTKKVKWSIKSGKSNVTLKNKKKNSVGIQGKKAGKAKVQAAVSGKKLICNVTVTGKKNGQTGNEKPKTSAAPSANTTLPPQNTVLPNVVPTATPAQQPTGTPVQQPTAAPEQTETPPPAQTQEPLEEGEFRYEGLDMQWIEDNIDPDQPVVAMSFDDGPGTYSGFVDYGMKIQEALKDAGAHATFFYIGAHIAKGDEQRKEVESAVENGFEIANHSYDSGGLDAASLDADAIRKKIDDTNELLSDISGYSGFLFRAPNVAYGKTMSETIDMPFIDVSCWSNDYQETVDKDAIVENVKKAKDGDIINMHSVHEKTAQAVPEILAYFKEQGIQVVSVSELFAIKGVKIMKDKIYYSPNNSKDKDK